jgi:hypothetical protein
MESRGKFRAVGISLAALLFVLVSTSAVNASSACSVTVSPKSGSAGTVFSFHGKGFQPSELTLHKDAAEASSHELSNTGDPWTLSVHSRPGDEGQWNAAFASAGCTASATFSVTLSSTDLADGQADPAQGSVPLPLGLLVLGAGAGSGIWLGRRFRAVPAHNR